MKLDAIITLTFYHDHGSTCYHSKMLQDGHFDKCWSGGYKWDNFSKEDYETVDILFDFYTNRALKKAEKLTTSEIVNAINNDVYIKLLSCKSHGLHISAVVDFVGREKEDE